MARDYEKIKRITNNIVWNLPEGGAGYGANPLNSKDSNIYYGQMVNKDSVIKINAEKMRAFFHKYYTEEQLSYSPGSLYFSELFCLKFDMFKTSIAMDPYQGKQSGYDNNQIKSIVIGYEEYGDTLDYRIYALNRDGYNSEGDEISIEGSTVQEILEAFPDVEIPLSIFSGELAIKESEIYTLNMFLLGKLDGSQEAEAVDFNEKPIDWIEIVQSEEA